MGRCIDFFGSSKPWIQMVYSVAISCETKATADLKKESYREGECDEEIQGWGALVQQGGWMSDLEGYIPQPC